MKFSHLTILLALGVFPSLAQAADARQRGLLERLNPFRWSRARNTEQPLEPRNSLPPLEQHQHRGDVIADAPGDPAAANAAEWHSRSAERTTPAWATQKPREGSFSAHDNGGWFAQRTDEGRPPTVAELREHLLSRGVDPAIVERQVERLSAERRKGEPARAAIHAQDLELDQVRAELQARGIDPRQAERRLPESVRARALSERFRGRAHDDGAPESEQLRTRLSRADAAPSSPEHPAAATAAGPEPQRGRGRGATRRE